MRQLGGDEVHENPVGVALGALAIVGGLTFIGGSSAAAASIVCETPEGADRTRPVLERANAIEVRIEEGGESV